MLVQILKCRHNGLAPVGALIKLEQGTNYSHYAIRFTSYAGFSMVLDSTGRYGVALRPIDRFLETYDIVESIDVHIMASEYGFQHWYEQLLGIRYGFLQIIDTILHTGKLGGGIICNEVVLRMLKKYNLIKITDKELNTLDLVETSKILEKVCQTQQ